MKKIPAPLFALAAFLLLAFQLPVPAPTPAAQTTNDLHFSHQLWHQLLQKHISEEGSVNYTGMLSEKAVLDKYTATLGANPPQPSWSKEETKAFWINAYNAFTVKMILEHYPVASIRDIHKGNPWDVAWIKIGPKTYSLNNLENDILRPQYKDARIHFALNCGARSCPPLYNQAFTGEKLEEQLDALAKKFINDTRFNRISSHEASVSKIFEWYASDFGDLVTYLNRYAYVKLTPGALFQYREYDWALNGK